MNYRFSLALVLGCFALSVFGDVPVTCQSKKNGVLRALRVEFILNSDRAIEGVELSQYDPKTKAFHTVVSCNETEGVERPNGTSYLSKNYNYFDLCSDVFDKYDLLLPKKVEGLDSFTAYLQTSFSEGRPTARALACAAESGS